jgi:hypothetical protein
MQVFKTPQPITSIIHPPKRYLTRLFKWLSMSFKRQHKEQKNYSWLQMSDKRWFVMRNSFNTEQDDYIPCFVQVREVNLTKECYMHCNCGYHC